MSELSHLDHMLRVIAPIHVERIASLRRSKSLIQSPVRSKATEVSELVCPKTNTIIQGSSSIERHSQLISFADRKVVRVREQALRLPWKDEAGQVHSHTVDVLAITSDGEKIAILDKPHENAVKMGLHEFARKLAATTPRSVVSKIIPLTDRDMPEDEIRTAELFFSARRDRRTEIDAKVLELAPSLVEDTPIAKITAQLGGGRVAFRPVVRAIFYGTLLRVTAGVITPDTLVRFSGTVMPDLDQGGPSLTSSDSRLPINPPVQKTRSGRARSYRTK